jgi:hypothetical protein
LTELNEKFCVNLDCHPSFERSVSPPFTEHNAGRTVFIGASNMGKIAKAAAENGHMIVDLNSSGWTPKPGKIEKLCEAPEKLNLTEIDTVVIDPMANSAYLGTDEDGLPIPAEKSDEDGRYHLFGDLQLAPPLCLQKLFKAHGKGGVRKSSSLFPCLGTSSQAAAKTRNTCQTACPVNSLPRSLAPKNACLKRPPWTGKARFLNILSFFGSCESPPQDLTTVDGTSIWAGDGVHLTSNASRVAARKLMADLARGGEEGEPATKRTRLESVVPAPAPAKKKVAAMGQPPSSPPRPCRRHRRSGSLASCRRPRAGEDPVTKTLPRGGGTGAWQLARRKTGGPTVDREGRSKAASAAHGAAGRFFNCCRADERKMSEIFLKN